MSDVEACRRGLVDGTIDCIVTDHAPHTTEEKAAGFVEAPAGVVGLETALGVAAEAMIATGLADWPRVVEWLTCGPAKVLRRSPSAVDVGTKADLAVIDPNLTKRVDSADFFSMGRNTPFQGRNLAGWAVGTIRGGTVRFADGWHMRT
jgi:dihydroorotase